MLFCSTNFKNKGKHTSRSFKYLLFVLHKLQIIYFFYIVVFKEGL